MPRLLSSVRNQHNISYEHILVDDFSKDGSYELLKSAELIDPKIKILRLDQNSGPVIARNEAIKHASGKYLAFLDADDYWLPNKLSVQVELMENTGAIISFCDYRTISEDGTLIGRRISGLNKIYYSTYHMTRFIGCLTVMINREKVPDFYFPNLKPSVRAEDFLAWSNLIKDTGPALRVPHDLARYTKVKNSRSSFNLKSALSIIIVYFYLEKLPLLKGVFYYTCFAFFSLYKLAWYRPIFKSYSVDGEVAKSYSLVDSKGNYE